MKRLIYILFLLPLLAFTADNIPTKGRVQVVTRNADYRVKIVTNYPDVEIRKTSRAPGNGEWQFVSEYPDFTIQYVNDNPDFTVRFVKDYPAKRTR